MKNKRNLFLLFFGLISITIWQMTKLDYEMNDPDSSSVSILFEQFDPSISEVSCFTFNYPAKNKVVIKPKNETKIIVPNALNKVILCEANIKGKVFPFFWQYPGKNMASETLLSRGVYANQSNITVNKLAVITNAQQIIAYAGKSDLTNLDNLVDFNGEYQFKNLSKFPLESHTPLCTFCNKKIKENSKLFIDQINLKKENFIDSAIMNFWYLKENYENCGKVSGFPSSFLKNLGLEAQNDINLKPFNWSNNLIDGWEDVDAIATRKFLDCSFNEASEQWQCAHNEDGSSKILLDEGQKCSSTNHIATQKECTLLYFNEQHKDSKCSNKVFYNIGQEPRISLTKAPSSKGMSFSQRVVFLTEDTFGFQSSIIYSQPLFKNNINYPCKIFVELSGVFKKDQNQDIFIYAELRNINVDHKAICLDSIEDKQIVKSFILGKKI